MSVMVVSIPLPGYIAKRLNHVQSERMKKVRQALPLVDILYLLNTKRRISDRCTRAVCDRE